MKTLLCMVRQFSRRFAFMSAGALLALFFLVPTSSFAATHTTQKCGANDVQCVITFGDQRITERLTALNTLDTKVTTEHTNQHIDDAHSDALHADIKTNVDGLNTLKTKLDGETTAKDARTDVKNIYEQFRIFAVVIPRDTRRLHLSIEIHVHDVLVDLKPHVETLVDNAPADKKDKATSLFNDFKTQLTSAETQIDTAQNTWPLLTPDSYNTNRATYNTNATTLKTAENTAHTDLHTTADDLHQISQLLKKK